LNGVYYTFNETAKKYGYSEEERQVGLIAQELQNVLSEAVTPAPFDLDEIGLTKSGEDYLTIQYEKVIPLLLQAIKEQQSYIAKLFNKLEENE
jgi:flagellar capping protein FliD